ANRAAGSGSVAAPAAGSGSVAAPAAGSGSVAAPAAGSGSVAASAAGSGSVAAPAAGTAAGGIVSEELVGALLASGVRAVLVPMASVSGCAGNDGLVAEFGRRRYGEGKGRAAALREAQLSVMRGSPDRPVSGAPGTGTGGSPAPADGGAAGGAGSGVQLPAAASGSEDGSDPAGSGGRRWTGRDGTHPCFWAPYVLEGDWR
ncbi:MAG: CHAT domain-containing protein, partial [Deltaproteobacteria bacterium]|nr:CHAT domain-containing protein [Deltaproteobacteria bacterium]